MRSRLCIGITAEIVSGLFWADRISTEHDRSSAVTSTITDLVINLISDRANLLDSFVILYATLLAALYKVKGLEFGKSSLVIPLSDG
jgi:hypothetical protein